MADVRAAGARAEPARSVLALLDDLVALVRERTARGAELTVHTRRRDLDRLVAATGPRAAGVDETRADTPWRTVLGAPGPVILTDLRSASGCAAWPRWREATVAAGFGSAVVVGATLPRGGAAVLSLYLDEPGAVDAQVVRRVAGFAGQIASLIALHDTIPARGRPARPVEAPRRSRASIEQAVGVLMEVRGCDEREARHVLTVLAGRQGRPLEQVAGSVLDRAVRGAGRVAGPSL
jgi:hypothetical protein